MQLGSWLDNDHHLIGESPSDLRVRVQSPSDIGISPTDLIISLTDLIISPSD